MRELGPNWYAAVMGVAIVATAGEALPVRLPGLPVVWGLSAAMLVVLLVARAAHWIRHGDRARADLLEPRVAPFYGCLAMGLLAVGGGALATGVPGGLLIDLILWCVGTVVALVVAVAVTYLMVAHQEIHPGPAAPAWLLPLVAPMVSAALGPQLLPALPAGEARETMIMACLALFGLSLVATLVLLPVVFSRLVHYGPPPIPLTPTLFLVLGPLGQSTTALGNLADVDPDRFLSASVLYGVPVIGFALLWLALAIALVIGAVRQGLRFAMTWWAFTFPVGTCVTGTASLARHTGLSALDWLAGGFYAFLVVAVLAASAGTLRGLLRRELLVATG